MIERIRHIIWRVLGIDYQQALKVYDDVFLKNDLYSKIGYKSYDNGAKVFRWTNTTLNIGKFCSIANNVCFIVDEGFHGSAKLTTYPLVHNLFKMEINSKKNTEKVEFLKKIKQKEGITIGNDVWIGMGSLIMPGVSIGNGVTIAANAVVTKDIPDYSVAAGVPAKVIKQKFDNNTISKLNKIAWWDWDIEIIKDRIEEFYGEPMDFINKYETKK